MARQGYWAEYPLTFRNRHIKEIASWIAIDESGVLVGGSGMGKSNFVNFIGTHPHLLATQARKPELLLVNYDVNSLPAITTAYFYRGMANVLFQAASSLSSDLQQALTAIMQMQTNWDDAFSALWTLQQLHQTVIHQTGSHVLWVMDRFDAAVQQLDSQTLNSLRSLRDQFKGQLSYIFVTRHLLSRLRNPSDFDELHEIVAANTCWLNPLDKQDAAWVLGTQMAERLQVEFSSQETARMIGVTGGLPAFAKFIAIAHAEGEITNGQSDADWCNQLLLRREFQRNCNEIWEDLTSEEQSALTAIAHGEDTANLDETVVGHLTNGGFLCAGEDGSNPVLFSPLFQAFITLLSGGSSGEIGFNGKTRDVTRNGVSLNIDLTRHEEILLRYFLEHSGEVAMKEDIMSAVWNENEVFEGVRDDRLAQLIKRLREKIEPIPAKPIYVQTVRGRGYKFEQPG